MGDAVVISAVEVPVDPDTAFRIFTEEFDDWWVRSPTTFYDGARAREMRMEPGVGGRVLEVYADDPLDALERGRITIWEPGRRLAYVTPEDTEADFRFEGDASITRVSVELRASAGQDIDGSVVGTANAMLSFFSERAGHPGHVSWAERDLARVLPVIEYENPVAATAWLIAAFGLEGRRPDPATWDMPCDFPIPLALPGGGVIVVGREAGSQPTRGPRVYAYVDDLDAHFARAQEQGATIVQEIRTYGDRNYVVTDLEGNRWTFAQARPTQPVPPARR